MRWYIFAIFAYVMLATEQGLRTLFAIGHVSPSFLLVLAVFLALTAPPATALWAAIILGILVDLQPITTVGWIADTAVIGPACLGFMAAVATTLQLRNMVFRDSPITIGVMVFVAGLCAHLVMVCLLTARGVPWLTGEPMPGWNVADQLVHRFFEVMYTAVWAIPIGWFLARYRLVWGFSSQGAPGPSKRYQR